MGKLRALTSSAGPLSRQVLNCIEKLREFLKSGSVFVPAACTIP